MNELWNDKRKRQQFLFGYATFLLNGMMALSVGSLLPFIRETRAIDYAFGGVIVSMHSVGNLISSFFAGTLSVAVGRKRSILFFNIFYALSYALIIFGNHNICLALAFLLTGLARGATSNFNNQLVNNLAPGKAWIINGLHAMFSVGAFAFPLLLTALTATATERWVYACYFMLAMGVLSWLMYLLIPVDEEKQEKKEDNKSWGFFREPLFLLCTATLFFYLCAEQGVIGWMVTYFEDTGLLSSSLSQMMASIQWIMILAGRLTTAYLSTKIEKSRLLRIMGAGLVLFFVVLITARTTPQIVIGIVGFGYSMAGIYPTTVSFAGGIIQKYSLAWSFILTIAGLGSIIMPSVIGKIAETSGIFSGMCSIVAVVIVDMLLIIALTAHVRRKKDAI